MRRPPCRQESFWRFCGSDRRAQPSATSSVLSNNGDGLAISPKSGRDWLLLKIAIKETGGVPYCYVWAERKRLAVWGKEDRSTTCGKCELRRGELRAGNGEEKKRCKGLGDVVMLIKGGGRTGLFCGGGKELWPVGGARLGGRWCGRTGLVGPFRSQVAVGFCAAQALGESAETMGKAAVGCAVGLSDNTTLKRDKHQFSPNGPIELRPREFYFYSVETPVLLYCGCWGGVKTVVHPVDQAEPCHPRDSIPADCIKSDRDGWLLDVPRLGRSPAVSGPY